MGTTSGSDDDDYKHPDIDEGACDECGAVTIIFSKTSYFWFCPLCSFREDIIDFEAFVLARERQLN